MRRRLSGDDGRGPKTAAGIAAVLALLLASCSTDNLFGTSPAPASSPSPSFGQRISSMFGGTTSTVGAPGGPPIVEEINCPSIDVRAGASTFSVTAASSDPSALSLRYQGSLGQTARECANLGATMTIKVGVQGRIVLGPAGAPGPVEVPLRLAVVREGPEPQTIWTKFYKIPLVIQPGQNSVPFTHVEQDMTFPTPPPGDLDQYVIYIGFDPLGLRAQPERKPRPPQRKS